MTIKKCDRCKCIQDNTDEFIVVKSCGYAFDLCPSCATYFEELKKCLITSFMSYPKQSISIHIGELENSDEPIQRKLEGCRKGGYCKNCEDKYICKFSPYERYRKYPGWERVENARKLQENKE